MPYETTSIKLLKQEDWLAWFDFIKNEAVTAKIWKFVDPGEDNPPSNPEPDLLYYTRDRATPTNTPSSTNTLQPSTEPPTEPPADPNLEQYLAGQNSAGRWNFYRLKLAQYEKNEKSLATLSRLIRTTVGTNFSNYLFNERNPHKLLQTLQRITKPSKAAV